MKAWAEKNLQQDPGRFLKDAIREKRVKEARRDVAAPGSCAFVAADVAGAVWLRQWLGEELWGELRMPDLERLAGFWNFVLVDILIERCRANGQQLLRRGPADYFDGMIQSLSEGECNRAAEGLLFFTVELMVEKLGPAAEWKGRLPDASASDLDGFEIAGNGAGQTKKGRR